MDKTFHTIPLTAISGTLSRFMGITPPKFATAEIPGLYDNLIAQIQDKTFDRVVVFNPDAIGKVMVEKHPAYFTSVRKYAPEEVKMLSMLPPKTPVCFASIYTGATPAEHGIQHYEKPVVKTDSLFDALLRAGKKCCIVAVKGSSMDLIFRERNIDYFTVPYDGDAVKKAVELIKGDVYDFIAVYVQEYDDKMHRSQPNNPWALNAVKRHASEFESIALAVSEYYKAHNTLLAFMPDHGVHLTWYGLGQHGKNIPKDMNVLHFYGAYPKTK